jgi:phytoene dehydrogenase-like protein
MSRPDAIVVGSGPNGLSAAITLAEGGRSVLLLEARERPGGAVATEELTLPGFHHDVFSAVHPAGAASPAFAAMELERHGLRWVHPRFAMVHVLEEGRAAVLSRDLGETVASLDALHPGDGGRWAAFVEPYLRHFGAMRRTLLTGFPPLRGPLELVARAGLQAGLELARVGLMAARDLGRELFAGPGSRAWLYGTTLHGDVPPPSAGSAALALYLNLLGHGVGWPSPEGGAGRLTEALCGRLRELGGELRTGAPVVRVDVRGGAARGVVLEGGEAIAAPLVLLDLTPRAVLQLAGHALPERYAAGLRRYRYGVPTFKVDWALSEPIPWTAPEARAAGTLHVGGDEGEVLRASAPVATPSPPVLPFLIAGQQTVADPTRAPAGQHTAWAYTRAWQEGRFSQAVDEQVERIEAQVERFAPGFRARILARHVLPPAELERRNASLVGGDVGGGSFALDQLAFRPVPSLVPYRTPLRGLYLGSAATFPGGAVHGVPGRAAARLALAESRLRPRLLR